LVSCLQRKLGLIKGPPGTGKGYTGIALIKVLLANLRHQTGSSGPIVCVTFTNHALDQLLEALVDKKITSQIARIGSQSKSARLAPFNLNSIAGETKRTKLEKEVTWSAHRDLNECQKDFHDLGPKPDLEDRVVPRIFVNTFLITINSYLVGMMKGFRFSQVQDLALPSSIG
jgi:hypothetical protein